MMEKHIFVSEDTPDGIFTAIYDAWAARIPDDEVSFQVENGQTMELFATYHYIETDFQKAEKVVRSVRKKISNEAYEQIFKASLSYEEDKTDAIYHFLKLGFKVGKEITNMHAKKEVCRVYELWRNVNNEAHTFLEFVRFVDLENGLLLAKIRPKNQVLPLLADHFSDRFPEENFAIIDEYRDMGIFHERHMKWFLSPIEKDAIQRIWNQNHSQEYEKLWKLFFKTIAIEPRRYYRCQRNLCSLRFRDYMVEFHG